MAKKSNYLFGLYACLILIHQASFALQATCYPSVTDVPESANWPICVIYLHGLHPSNDEGDYTKYERKNRPIVDKFKKQYLNGQHCRVAAPVAPDGRYVKVTSYLPSGRSYTSTVYRKTVNRDWQNRSLATIEEAAKNACGGPDVKLAPKRALIGFSAGGWGVFKLANNKRDCRAVSEYGIILSIGMGKKVSANRDHSYPGACSNLKVYPEHDFAGQFTPAVKQQVADAVSVPLQRTQYAEAQTGAPISR